MNRRDLLKLAPLAPIALSGCGAVTQPSESADHLPASQTGWLIGSLGAKWNNAALIVGLRFHPQDQPGRSTELRWSNQRVLGMARSGVEVAPQAGSDEPLLGVQSLRLAPGRYVFNELIARPWKLTPKDGSVVKVKLEDMRVAFEVQAGRATYFGELAAWLTADVPLFLGLGVPREMVMTLRDRTDRDLSTLRRSGLPIPEGAPIKVDWAAGVVPDIVIQRA